MKYIRLIFVLLILGVAVWLYISSKQDKTASDASYKAVSEKLSHTEAEYSKYRLSSDSAFSNATATAVQNGELAKKSQSELDQYRNQVKTLLKLLDSAEKETPDSSWVQVSPNYKWGCDSLRHVNAIQDALINQYEQDNQAHVDALGYETQIRDSALQKEREFSNAFRLQLVYCSDALSKAATPGKTQLYAGMAAWGNSVSPLGGGEINLGIKTKSDQFYEIKGAYLNTWWVGIGTKFKIKF